MESTGSESIRLSQTEESMFNTFVLGGSGRVIEYAVDVDIRFGQRGIS